MRLIRWLFEWRNESELWIFLPVMGALALAGVILAGSSETGLFRSAGFALFAVALVWIFLALQSYYDAKDNVASKGVARLMWLIEWLTDWKNENDLWVFLPIMGALALVGVVLAGHFEEGMFHYAGVALFVVSILWIFMALKGYFDARDRGKTAH